MDIILLENIDELGIVGDTVKVKDGYARNYLLPRKLACRATPENLNFYQGLIESRRKKLAKAKGSAEELRDRLNETALEFIRKSQDEESRLFGSVTNADVADALEAKGFDLDKRRVLLTEPIKKLGEYTAEIRLHPEVTAQVKVVVRTDDEAADAERGEQ